jgi:CheY-like chemotaxis protein
LALVQELVKLHSGQISVESVLGRGTTFSVIIPKGTAHLPADRIGARKTLAPTSAGNAYVAEAEQWISHATGDDVVVPGSLDVDTRVHILLADDNPDMREYLARLLRARWVVEAVGDGGAALAAIRRRRPALVLTDVMMPGLDGFSLLRALRGDPSTRSIPVIMLSARAGEESRVEGLEAGADDYLVKPFSSRELIARVAARLGQRHSAPLDRPHDQRSAVSVRPPGA